MDYFTSNYIEGSPRECSLHRVCCLDESCKTGQLGQSLFETADGFSQFFGVFFAAILLQQFDDGQTDKGGLSLFIFLIRFEFYGADILTIYKLYESTKVCTGEADVWGSKIVAYQLSHHIGTGQIAEAIWGF